MGLRAAPTEETDVSAAEIVFGVPLVLPGQILDTEEPLPVEFVTKLRQSSPLPLLCPLSYAQMAAKPAAALLSVTFVYVRKGGKVPPLWPLYSGPYKVLSSEPKVFWLQVGEREEVVSIEPLKPHRPAAAVQPALPPARGRPLDGCVFSSSTLGLVFAGGPVAEKIDKISSAENPPNCVGEIRKFNDV
jgi:hypothetical protein